MIRINLANKDEKTPTFFSKPQAWQVVLLVALLCILFLGFLMVGCAKPMADTEYRLQKLKLRGVDTLPLERELKAQQDKFALFRSYKKADEILAAMERGDTRYMEVAGLTSPSQGGTNTTTTIAGACYCPCECPNDGR